MNDIFKSVNLNQFIDSTFLNFSEYYSDKYYNFYDFRNIVDEFVIKHNLKLIINLIDFCDDLNILNKVHVLYFKRCYNITDVSMLKSVYCLDISRCFKIININMLYNVQRLCMFRCFGIKDIGSLRNIEYLNVSISGFYGLHLLKNILTIFIADKHKNKMSIFTRQTYKLAKIKKHSIKNVFFNIPIHNYNIKMVKYL